MAGVVLALLALPAAAQSIGQPEGVARAILPNGLRVVVIPDHLAPVVTTQLNYLAGSNDAPDGFPGMAHALEHMMFRGSDGLDRDQFAQLGAQLGGAYNASTTETVTRYTFTVPSEDVGVALRVEALRMEGASLKEEDWDEERGAIEQEVSRDLSSPFYVYSQQAQALLFAGTPYEHDALGTRPSFERTDSAMLRRFYQTWYAPNNAILVIAGDVQPQAALAEATAAFGAVPRREVPPHAPVTMRAADPRTLTLQTDFPIGVATLAFRMPGMRSPDFAAADVLGDVLGSKRYGLYGLVPAGHALLSRFNYRAKPEAGIGLALAGFAKDAEAAPLLAAMADVLGDAAEHGVPKELVEAAKREEVTQIALEADSIEGLATAWSNALAEAGLQSPDDLAKAYMAVTPEQVNRLAATLLDPHHTITAVLTPRPGAQPGGGSGFGGAESFSAVPSHMVALPPWAEAALATLHVPDPGPVPDVTILPNGLRLIVQPEQVSHTVSVYGQVRQVPAMQEPPGQEGVASLTSGLFEAGTALHDRLAFRAAVDDIAAFESAGDSFSLRVLASRFAAGMQLLAENMLQPAFPAGAVAVQREQLAQSAGGMLQSPGYLAAMAMAEATVPAQDPVLRQATPASIRSLTREDVLHFYAAAYRPDLTTIVVVGDVTPEEARRVVTETFGGWQAAGVRPAIDLPRLPPNAPSQRIVNDTSTLQASVDLAETLPLLVDDPQRYPLQLGNLVLGGGFASRLYQDLRIKAGLVYSVSSGFRWSRTRSEYRISFGADPAMVARARAIAVRDLAAMGEQPVSPEELQLAKAQMLRRLPMRRASVAGIAGSYLQLADLGLPLDLERHAADHYLGLTPGDVQAAFARAVRPEGFAAVVEGPPAP